MPDPQMTVAHSASSSSFFPFDLTNRPVELATCAFRKLKLLS
jgi:hypothetical protein